MPRWKGVTAAALVLISGAAAAQDGTDWPNLQRYAKANAELPPPAANEDRVVFMGNSIFDKWAPHFATTFPRKPYISRAIGGQTTPQMLVRFRQDVIALRPKVVVILAGTNDIAGNTGPSTLEMIENNLASMVELAKAHWKSSPKESHPTDFSTFFIGRNRRNAFAGKLTNP